MATTEIALRDYDSGALEQSRFMPVMSIETAVNRRNVIVQAVQKLMKDGQDFGTIPGTPKPTLYQPGADKLNNLFGLVPKFTVNEKMEDWTGERHGGEPFFSYTVTCHLFRGDYLMGEGSGSCNSWESKYRYRKSERVCPQCGKDTIIKGKQEYGGGWLCFARKGGCGAKFKAGDSSIEGQQVGRVANPDIFDLVNTILKMANKRAKIAATLNATSAHEFFTQDVEDIAQMQSEAENIDTGSHQAGTKAAANHVAERKIAELRQQQQPKPAPAPLEVVPEDAEQQELSVLDRTLLTFTSKAAIAAAFGELKSHFVRLLPADVWAQIMAEHGVNDEQKQFGTIGNAKKCFTAAWNAAEKAMQEIPAEEEPANV